ncbi:unnamed protein product [Caenorhabditis brenneri]
MARTPEHPLLSLPDDEIIGKLGGMNLNEILKFSLVSERSKELVKLLQIKGTFLHVSIERDITVSIETWLNVDLRFYGDQDKYWGVGAYGRKKKLTAPQSVSIGVYGRTAPFRTRYTSETSDLTMQEWLKHLQDIFNYHKINHIHFCEHSSQFDIDDIKVVFEKTKEVKIEDTGCFVFNQMILQKFFPLEKLRIKTTNFPDSIIPKKILVQNFVDLEIGEIFETTSMTLDELLLTNSKILEIEGLQMSAKQINKFIKLWQRGSNPQLEYLSITYENVEEGDQEIIMRGIDQQVIPTDQIRKFKPTGNGMPDVIEGGIDFFRIDGVKATIQWGHPFPSLEIFVWFDHCVIEA